MVSYPSARQSASTVLMVRPTGFEANRETVATNEFQGQAPAGGPEIVRLALREFDGVVRALEEAGVRVLIFDPPRGVEAPDAVFPNNWISTHPDGTVILYPMLTENRRIERQPAIVDALAGAYQVRRRVDLSPLEREGEIVEGTGSLVLDHLHRVAYAALSPRTTPHAVARACEALGYEPCTFTAAHASGAAIYHTNVVLSIGTEMAIVCLDSVPDFPERDRLQRSLEATGRQVVALSESQMLAFGANVLEVRAKDPVLAISNTAWRALQTDQRQRIERHVAPCVVNVETIERVGGGGVRCMLAEVFLPPRSAS